MHKKNGVTTMRNKTIKSDRCVIYAPDRNRNIYDDYVEDILLPVDKKTFEKHLEDCPICTRQVVEALRREEIVKKSPLMSKIGQKRSLNRKLQYLDEILGRDVVPMEYVALAASPPRRLDVHGVAYGVAVDRETGRGALLECIAVISDAAKLKSKLEIRAIESKPIKKGRVEELQLPQVIWKKFSEICLLHCRFLRLSGFGKKQFVSKSISRQANVILMTPIALLLPYWLPFFPP
jgi:hypothetical protein